MKFKVTLIIEDMRTTEGQVYEFTHEVEKDCIAAMYNTLAEIKVHSCEVEVIK